MYSRGIENSLEDLDAELKDYDGGDIINHTISHMDWYNPFITQGEIYLGKSMYGTARWTLIKYNLYKHRVFVDGPLNEYQIFNSKEQL
jgi:hypothetical protein